MGGRVPLVGFLELIAQEAEKAPDQKPHVHVNGIEEVVADKGYHSGAVLAEMKMAEVRTYIAEKKQRVQGAKPRDLGARLTTLFS